MAYKLGIRIEDTSPWERRTPLVPNDVKQLIQDLGIEVLVQKADHRVFTHEEYRQAGTIITDDLKNADGIFSIKEVPEHLIYPDKLYVNFAHVIKGQPYNMPKLKKYIESGCTLIDYERIVDHKDKRIVFFGNYAGLAGMIDTLWTFGDKMKKQGVDTPFSSITQALHYPSLKAAKEAVAKAGKKITQKGLPSSLVPLTCGFTGYGNVSKGAQEILDLLPFIEITPDELLTLNDRDDISHHHIYKVVFKEKDMVKPVDEQAQFQLQDYFDNPEKYQSVFSKYIPFLSMLVNAIYWTEDYPRLVTKSFVKELYNKFGENLPLKVIGDVSCDVEGAVEITLRSTLPDNPVFTYFPSNETAIDGIYKEGISIVANYILPAELPREASEFFSETLKKYVEEIIKVPEASSIDSCSCSDEIKRSIIVFHGKITPDYEYLTEKLEEGEN